GPTTPKQFGAKHLRPFQRWLVQPHWLLPDGAIRKLIAADELPDLDRPGGWPLAFPSQLRGEPGRPPDALACQLAHQALLSPDQLVSGDPQQGHIHQLRLMQLDAMIPGSFE